MTIYQMFIAYGMYNRDVEQFPEFSHGYNVQDYLAPTRFIQKSNTNMGVKV